MAPEIMTGENYSGSVADIFSSGVILFTMVRGGPPFLQSTKSDKYFKLLAAD